MMHMLLITSVAVAATIFQPEPTTRQTVEVRAETRVTAPEAPPTPELKAVLDRLHKRGLTLDGFTADVSFEERDNDLGITTIRTGGVKFSDTRRGAARLLVSFLKVREDDRDRNERIEYLLDGPILTDRNYKFRKEVRRQVLQPGEKVNLLKLGEGPFPLPIGQDPAEVLKQFQVLPPEGQGPAGGAGVVLVPRPGTKLADKLSRIEVWVDAATDMPTTISTVEAGGMKTRLTTLSAVKVNPAFNDADFQLQRINLDEWSVTEIPFDN